MTLLIEAVKRILFGLFLTITVCLFFVVVILFFAVMIPTAFVAAIVGWIYITPDWKIETKK